MCPFCFGRHCKIPQSCEILLTRSILYKDVCEATAQLCHETLYQLREDIYAAIERSVELEVAPSDSYLDVLLQNADIASQNKIPLQQDVGLPQFYIEVGHDVVIEGGSIKDALVEGLQNFISSHPYRLNILEDPLSFDQQRQDILPLRYNLHEVEGDGLTIRCIRTSSDSERVSRVAVFASHELFAAIDNFVMNAVLEAQLRTPPPLLIGVGIGGSQDESGALAKRALLRPIGKPPDNLASARLEQDILNTVNQLGIGPGGLGGLTTALAVHVASAPCTPEAIPVAVRLMGSTPCMSEVVF